MRKTRTPSKSKTGDKWHTEHTVCLLRKMQDQGFSLPVVGSSNAVMIWENEDISTIFGPEIKCEFEKTSTDPRIRSYYTGKPTQADAIFSTEKGPLIAEFKNGVCDFTTRNRAPSEHCVELVLRNDTLRLLVARVLDQREEIASLFDADDPFTNAEVSEACDNPQPFHDRFLEIQRFLSALFGKLEEHQKPLIFCQVWQPLPFSTDVFAITDVAVGRILVAMSSFSSKKLTRFYRALIQLYLMIRYGVKTGSMNELVIHKMGFGCQGKDDKIGNIPGLSLYKIVGSHQVFYKQRFDSKFVGELQDDVPVSENYVARIAQDAVYRTLGRALSSTHNITEDEIEDAITNKKFVSLVDERSSQIIDDTE